MFDSRLKTPSEFALQLAGEDGDMCTFPANVMVWGDVRIDVYKHTKKVHESKRKAMCYMVLNTCFYGDQTEIKFPKNKLDMLRLVYMHC